MLADLERKKQSLQLPQDEMITVVIALWKCLEVHLSNKKVVDCGLALIHAFLAKPGPKNGSSSLALCISACRIS